MQMKLQEMGTEGWRQVITFIIKAMFPIILILELIPHRCCSPFRSNVFNSHKYIADIAPHSFPGLGSSFFSIYSASFTDYISIELIMLPIVLSASSAAHNLKLISIFFPKISSGHLELAMLYLQISRPLAYL